MDEANVIDDDNICAMSTAWLQPVILLEKIRDGFFKLNDRQRRFVTDRHVFTDRPLSPEPLVTQLGVLE